MKSGHAEVGGVEDLVPHGAAAGQAGRCHRQAHVVHLVDGHSDHRLTRGHFVGDALLLKLGNDRRGVLLGEAAVGDGVREALRRREGDCAQQHGGQGYDPGGNPLFAAEP